MGTKAIDVTAGAWVKVGTGPLYIEARQSDNAYIHFAATAPSANTNAYHDLKGPDWFSYSGTENCYARAAKETITLTVTEGAS